MARKVEPGIDYYPCNSDITTHKKVKLLFAKHGSDGFWIYMCLLSEIYKNKGYFIDTRIEDDLIIFAQDHCKRDIALVKEVIQACVDRDLFDKALFDNHGVLSSDRIQENYLGATNRRLHGVKMIREYLLVNPVENEKIIVVDINGENVDIYPKYVNSNDENEDRGTQNKERINKNKIKGEGEYIIPPELFEKLFKWVRKKTVEFYPAELKRCTDEALKYQRDHEITQEKVDADPGLDVKYAQVKEQIFEKHLGKIIRAEINACYDHYAARDFHIDGRKIVSWYPVLSGWMRKREQFKKQKAS